MPWRASDAVCHENGEGILAPPDQRRRHPVSVHRCQNRESKDLILPSNSEQGDRRIVDGDGECQCT